ncbi:hypothetical protein YC2023_109929 [Brassica napus]
MEVNLELHNSRVGNHGASWAFVKTGPIKATRWGINWRPPGFKEEHMYFNIRFFFYLMQLFHGEAQHLFTDMPKGELKNLFFAYGLFKAYEGLEFSRTGSTAVKTVFD